MPEGSGLAVVMEKNGAVIVSENAFEAEDWRESVAVTVKLKLPAVVGVPVMIPFEFRVNPAGSWPATTTQVYGVVPPLADRPVEYAVPTAP